MDIKEIVRDSLRYPFSDWKKFLFLGVLILINGGLLITSFEVFIPLSKYSVGFFVIIEFIVGILVSGYLFKIVKSSLDGGVKLPEFASWSNLFINGIKVFIISIVYFMPIILIVLAFLIMVPSKIGIAMKIFILSDPSSVSQILLDLTNYLGMGIWYLISILYMIILNPIVGIAIAHMAYHDSKFGAAFKFREILNKIGSIGWKNFILWYIVIGYLYLVLYVLGILIITFFEVISVHYYPSIEIVLLLLSMLIILILLPFRFMYFTRALALFYKSE